MTGKKAVWQCVTPGCRRAMHTGDLCGACAKAARPKPARTPRDIHTTIYPTGATRRCDGVDQAEYTDGHQTWWTNVWGTAA